MNIIVNTPNDGSNSDFSIRIRFQKVIQLETSISVPVTSDELLNPTDLATKLDVDKIFAKGLLLAQKENTHWIVESENINIHPIQ